MVTPVNSRRLLMVLALVALCGADGRCGYGTEPVMARNPPGVINPVMKFWAPSSGGGPLISGATIRILDGCGAGRWCVTNEYARCEIRVPDTQGVYLQSTVSAEHPAYQRIEKVVSCPGSVVLTMVAKP